MASGSSTFLYEDDFDIIMAVIAADKLQIDEKLNLEICSCIKNMLSKNKIKLLI